MADSKISALTASTTPLAGTEVLPIVQGGTTKKVSVANLTVGRAVDGLSFAAGTAASEITLSATGLAASGTDTDISIKLTPKGAGATLLGVSSAGTIPASASPVNSWVSSGWGVTSGSDNTAYNLDRISFNSGDFYVINQGSTGVYLHNGNNSWSSLSDARHKDIIEPITNAVNKVATLRAVIGKYKSDDAQTRRSFLIAQDVLAVLPEAVDVTKPEMLGLSYTDVIPLLVAAINELNAEIVALKAR